MIVFKTLDDILNVERIIITRESFDNLIESEFVEWWEDVTYDDFAPFQDNCSTYDIKVKVDDEEYTRFYVFVEDEEYIPYEIGEWYKFGELWDGNGNGQQLLADECIAIDEDYVVEFTVLEYNNDDILDTIIEVTNIY